jgi:chromosome segregation protein
MIVTHQKRTMEIAGMMYGVSMSKDGTSRVVCQTLETTAAEETRVEVPEAEPVH